MHYNVNSELLKSLGDRIRKERSAQGLSQSQLAFETETTLRQIQRIEKGEYHAGILFYVNIARCLNLSFDDLLNNK